jgi:hypothetical protein
MSQRVGQGIRPWNFSPTAGELFSECPYAFSQKYELGIPEPATDPLLTGQLMASTLERYLAHCAEQKVPTDITALRSIARQTYAEQSSGIPLTALDEVLEICDRYAVSHSLDLDHLIGVEVWLPPRPQTLQIAGRNVLGKVDELYMDDEGRLATIRDAKTNWAVWSEEDTRKKLQARVYPILVAHAFPEVEEVEITFDFVRWGMERSVRWSRAEIDEETLNIEALIMAMQRPGKRPAVPGARCTYCAYTQRCPTFKSMKADGTSFTPATPEQAVAVAAEITVLEPAIAQRRKALRDWANQRGPVSVHGLEYGYFEHDTPTIDPLAFFEWAKKNDKDPFDYLKVGTTELRKLLKKHPGLEDLVGHETETKFDARKPEPEGQPA